MHWLTFSFPQHFTDSSIELQIFLVNAGHNVWASCSYSAEFVERELHSLILPPHSAPVSSSSKRVSLDCLRLLEPLVMSICFLDKEMFRCVLRSVVCFITQQVAQKHTSFLVRCVAWQQLFCLIRSLYKNRVPMLLWPIQENWASHLIIFIMRNQSMHLVTKDFSAE